ncbi:hypothetical protein KM043_013100 [Ampulex compressa]|nr:hypothetical protein KM043_013100 [Ampulex compressa]
MKKWEEATSTNYTIISVSKVVTNISEGIERKRKLTSEMAVMTFQQLRENGERNNLLVMRMKAQLWRRVLEALNVKEVGKRLRCTKTSRLFAMKTHDWKKAIQKKRMRRNGSSKERQRNLGLRARKRASSFTIKDVKNNPRLIDPSGAGDRR